VSSASIQSFSNARILVIGDVMLDHFVWGNVRRISPEAPVPVVEVVREDCSPAARRMWRATLQSSRSTALSWAASAMIGAAQQLRDLLEAEGVSTGTLIVNDTLPTISKTRIAARQQQIVRVDRETLAPLTDGELAEVERIVRASSPNSMH